ncbi:hypothetical protein COL154_009317 [Colletotrichum chrysophilum]|uniref:uncharacterized protein n=1 Tax=Colletotrichum chrysophilum TaxID=1836956 RepID=UPI0023002E9D|nr:uncharacterized protein COL26b_011052 [Colletotrichum chrysophilum]KAJ0358253.1 hypothetical protein COL154_009317 [Colletotrichum chrysophilum]KAJ0367933.1 hypothetical protein COL26b_011052 [Colletotrichum chrysophilum]
MCLTNNSIKLCGTLLSFYESKPKEAARLPLHDPAWAFVLPYFDKLVQHHATKWVKEPGNGALVSWCAVSRCYRWDEQQTAEWAHGGVDAVEAWMRQALGKTDWWQGEQPALVEQFGSMSLQAPSSPESVRPSVHDLNSPATDPAPAPETPNAWASLEHDPAFNPWGASEADEVPASKPVAEPIPSVDLTPAGPMPSPQPAPAANLAETDTVVSAPFSTVGNNTVISAPARTVYTPPQTPRTPRRGSVVGNSTVVSSPFSSAGTNTVIDRVHPAAKNPDAPPHAHQHHHLLAADHRFHFPATTPRASYRRQQHRGLFPVRHHGRLLAAFDRGLSSTV